MQYYLQPCVSIMTSSFHVGNLEIECSDQDQSVGNWDREQFLNVRGHQIWQPWQPGLSTLTPPPYPHQLKRDWTLHLAYVFWDCNEWENIICTPTIFSIQHPLCSKWEIKNFSNSRWSSLTYYFSKFKTEPQHYNDISINLEDLMEKVWIFWYIQDIKQIYILLHFFRLNINTENFNKKGQIYIIHYTIYIYVYNWNEPWF